MSMKRKKINFRVEVFPYPPWIAGCDEKSVDEKYIEACEAVQREVRRHVDNIESALVSWDVEKSCEHCGRAWTEADDSPHNGGCCDKDMEVFGLSEAEQRHK